MSILNYNPQLLLEDDAVPRFLRLTQEERRLAWERNPPKPMPQFGFERTETQVAYAEFIAEDKRKQRAKDEVRWAALKAKRAAEKEEIALVAVAVKRRVRV